MALLKRKKLGKDSSIDSKELMGDGVKLESSQDETVTTTLSYHPDWHVGIEQNYVYRFLNNECPPLKPNQISLAGIDLEKQENGSLKVTVFVRNSLNQAIRLGKTPLLLLDENGDMVAKKQFDLSVLGDIPARSSRPWVFAFAKRDVFSERIPKENWTLAFELKKDKHIVELEDSWEKSLAEEDKEKLRSFAASLTPPKDGEVNFMGIQAKQADNGDLRVVLLIRNGSNKNLSLEKLPLVVEDASGEVVAEGAFTLQPLQVKANTSKPWTFIFPKEMVLKRELDLTKWKAYPPKESVTLANSLRS